MPEPALKIYGARETRNTLRKMQVEGAGKALRESHKKIAKFLEGRTRGKGNAQQRKEQRGLLGKGTQRQSVLSIKNTAAAPFALAAYMGTKKQTGWYARARYNNSTGKQFPEWVGNNWDLLNGVGPYVIADQIQTDRQELLDMYFEEMRTTANALGLGME